MFGAFVTLEVPINSFRILIQYNAPFKNLFQQWQCEFKTVVYKPCSPVYNGNGRYVLLTAGGMSITV